jgi:hypothetical protein
MSTTTTTTSTRLLCPECRRENESERIYCHDCGTRLDRSAVHFKKEPIADTHKRVKRMFDPTRAKVRALFFAFSKMILGAGVGAVLDDMALPPEVPPPVKSEVLVSSLRFELESMVKKGQPPQKVLTEADANAFVAATVKTKHSSLDQPGLEFKRALLTFSEKRSSITVERSVMGYWSLFTTCSYAPELKNGRLLGKVQGGRIGRLPIHPQVAQFMGILFGDVSKALDRELKLVSSMGAIELHEKTLTLVSPTP